MGLFVLMLDSTVVTLALPAVRRELSASASELQWVVNGYLVVIAVLVVSLGRLGDMFGRRRIFLLGLAVFTAGLVVAATAPTIEVLIGARIVQGIGAGAMVPLSLALVSTAFSDADRPRAMGIWTGISALALALGPLVGGVLVEQLSWRWVFWIGVAPLALAFLWTARAVGESRDEGAGHRLDLPGLATLTVGLGGVVLALVEGDEWGWGSARTLAALAVGLAAVLAFAAVEPRVRQPVVDVRLFGNRPYLGASAAAFCLVGTWWAMIFYVPQYLEGTLGHGAVLAGVLVLPITAPMVVISPLASRLIERLGPRVPITVGMALATIGVGLTTRLGPATAYATLVPGFLLLGVALGLVYTSMSTAAMTAMPPAKAGIAAGVLGMNRLLAGSVVLAATGALDAALRHHHGAAFALSRSLWIVVALCALGTVLTWWLVRPPALRPAPAEPEREIAPAG